MSMPSGISRIVTIPHVPNPTWSPHRLSGPCQHAKITDSGTNARQAKIFQRSRFLSTCDCKTLAAGGNNRHLDRRIEHREICPNPEHYEQWVRERAQKQARMVACVRAPSGEPSKKSPSALGALATRDRRRTSRPCGDENRP